MPRPSRTTRRTRSAKTAPSVSLRAFAATVGVSHPAVVKAIKAGRLSKSIGRTSEGKPFIRDIDAAKREWKAGASRPNGKAPSVPAPIVAATEASEPPPGDTLDELLGRPGTLTEAQLRVTYQREVKLQLENELRKGTLVDATQARRDQYAIAKMVRDSMLNIPIRVSAELAAEADEVKVFARLEQEIRAALIGLAEALSAPADPGDADAGGGTDGE
jgi:hypothetical protein